MVHWLDAMERDYHEHHPAATKKIDYVYFVAPPHPPPRRSILNLNIDERKKLTLLGPQVYQSLSETSPNGNSKRGEEVQEASDGETKMLAEIEAEDIKELINNLIGLPRKILTELINPSPEGGITGKLTDPIIVSSNISRPSATLATTSTTGVLGSPGGIEMANSEINPHHYYWHPEHRHSPSTVAAEGCRARRLSFQDLRSGTPLSIDELPHLLISQTHEDVIGQDSEAVTRIVAEVELLYDPPSRGLGEVFTEPDLAPYLLRRCRKNLHHKVVNRPYKRGMI